jgi:hypothetical protein
MFPACRQAGARNKKCGNLAALEVRSSHINVSILAYYLSSTATTGTTSQKSTEIMTTFSAAGATITLIRNNDRHPSFIL